MINKKYLLLLSTFLVVSFASINLQSQTGEPLILEGIDRIYKIEFDSAEAIFDKVISDYPFDPEGYFFKAMVQWWRIYINRGTEDNDKEFFLRVDKVIEVTNNILEKDPNDAKALFYKGGAIGYRGLLRSIRSSWLNAASDGREALNLIEDASKINPENPDIIFGLGIYNYFAEFVPEKYPMLKPLMIIFPKGDRVKGLLQINQAIQNSHYARIEAENILGYINLRYEKNFNAAEIQFRNLHNKFPNNPIFEGDLGRALIGQSKWADALVVWKSVVGKSDSGLAGYKNLELKRDANYYTALTLLKLNRTTEAESFSVQAIELSEEIDDDDNAFKSYAYLHAGEIFGRNGKTGKAREYFDKVLTMENFNNIHEEANRLKLQF